jgi:D-psicose/D-tagatose/L-ribulose 3-epimerase
MSIKPNYEKTNSEIAERFRSILPSVNMERRLNLSWSNWGFGRESLEKGLRRLSANGIRYVELHGNRYGSDIGYDAGEVKKITEGEGIRVAGICGIFSAENDLSSVSGIQRQNAIDYIKRNLELGAFLKAGYMLIVPGAVGRPVPYDSFEFHRSVETLQKTAAFFQQAEIRGAIEPIRSAEVSFCHTFREAKGYIEAVSNPWINKINGDIYHMLTEEEHIARTILEYGDYLINLHMADTNRMALGRGMMDVDTILKALYIVGYNNENCFCTPEPLGPGGDPYPAMHGIQDPAVLDLMVKETAGYFRRREEVILRPAFHQ